MPVHRRQVTAIPSQVQQLFTARQQSFTASFNPPGSSYSQPMKFLRAQAAAIHSQISNYHNQKRALHEYLDSSCTLNLQQLFTSTIHCRLAINHSQVQQQIFPAGYHFIHSHSKCSQPGRSYAQPVDSISLLGSSFSVSWLFCLARKQFFTIIWVRARQGKRRL